MDLVVIISKSIPIYILVITFGFDPFGLPIMRVPNHEPSVVP